MCSHCRGDYEDPDRTAPDDEKEESGEVQDPKNIRVRLRNGHLEIAVLVPVTVVSEAAAKEARQLPGLTPREIQAVKGILRGQTNKEIAADMHVTERTVKFHVSQVLAKTALRTRHEVFYRYSGGQQANQERQDDSGRIGVPRPAEAGMAGPRHAVRGLRPAGDARRDASASPKGPVARAA